MQRLGAMKLMGSSPCPCMFTSVMLCQTEVVRLCLGHSYVTRARVWQGCLEYGDSDAILPFPPVLRWVRAPSHLVTTQADGAKADAG